MAVLKKAEFEKEIEEAITKATKLWCKVEAKEQFCDGSITTVTFEVQVAINGYVGDMPIKKETS